jgi:hypothetical protein
MYTARIQTRVSYPFGTTSIKELTTMTKTLVTFAAVSATAFALTACATTAQRISGKEDTLAAAGFTMLPANTPARQAELHKLPPNKFVPRTTGDTTQYVYADPVVCNCLYIGDQKAYGAYKQDMLAKKIADEQQMTAMTYQNAWDWGGWNWGPWGRGWWYR